MIAADDLLSKIITTLSAIVPIIALWKRKKK